MSTNQLPLYRKLYETLRQRIEEGVYRKGDLLPSENELCTLHRMTRPTVRKALDKLMHEGYILKQQGRDRYPFLFGDNFRDRAAEPQDPDHCKTAVAQLGSCVRI
jgi:DNA-binding transcriptional MocR family regulator